MDIILRPLIALALFLSAALIARFILRYVPEGRTKHLLSRRLPILPRNESERRDWKPFWLLLIASAAVFAWIDVVIWYSDGEPIFLQFLP